MAIEYLWDAAESEPDGIDDDSGRLEGVWPRPDLRLVEAPVCDTAFAMPIPTSLPPSAPELPWRVTVPELPVPGVAGPRTIREGVDVVRRRSLRRSRLRRRRRIAAVSVVAAALVLLALPISALGGRPLPRRPAAVAAGMRPSTFVVEPGDTLWSIAGRYAHGTEQRALVGALAAELGSEVVRPGERIPVP